MSLPNARDVMRSPGRLSIAPTALGVFPHGGTALGIVRAIEIIPNIKYHPVTAEEYGGIVVDQVLASESWVLAALLRSLDDDAIANLFPNTAAGSVSQRRVINAPGTVRAGSLRAASAVKLVFTPDSPDLPFVVLYRAIPMVDEAAKLTMAAGDALEIGVVFHAVYDGSTRMVSMGRAEDLTL